MSGTTEYRDPRLGRSDKKQSASPSRGDPRLRTQEQQQHWPPQQHTQLPHMAQMPQTHYTIGDGMTTYQHLVPSAAALYPPAAVAAPGPYQYPGYTTTAAYQPAAYGHPAYATYYTPAPPPQHIDQHAAQYQQPNTVQAAQTYAPQGAPQGSWAPARMSEQVAMQVQPPITAYMQQQQIQQQAAAASTTMTSPSPDITSTSKQDGVEQEMQQTQAEMRRQRDDYERRAAELSHELDQLKRQKRDLKQSGGGDRQNATILKENAKLQAEIQSKLKEYVNVVDILSGILGDRKKGSKGRRGKDRSHRSSERRGRTRSGDRDKSAGGESVSSSSSASSAEDSKKGNDKSNSGNQQQQQQQQQQQLPDLNATVQYNYVHYDPEVHWCRICDAFPRTAKDLLQHLHDDEHRHLMQSENIEIPWHKLPAQDKEFPYREGATKRRVPIKGLQFFVSAPAWYCRLCDAWIGDLHCASQHLKSIGHSQNYANFVLQNPQWENDWLEDRKKALDRVSKHLLADDKAGTALDLAGIEKKAKTLASISSIHLDTKKPEKNSSKKHSKKPKRRPKKGNKHSKDSDESSSQTSSSSSDDEDSSSENDNGVNDKSKSIRVAMRNQTIKSSSTMMDEQILILENLVKEKKRLQQKELELAELHTKAAAVTTEQQQQLTPTEDRLISQWMNVDADKSGSVGEKDKYLLDSLKDRLRQKHEAEQRTRLLRQQEAEEEMRKRIAGEEAERQRQQREERERKEQGERESSLSSHREQVKFRQFRGGKATTQRHRSSASPNTNTNTSPSSAMFGHRSTVRSRSRSSSTERRRGSRGSHKRPVAAAAATAYQRSSSRRSRSRSRSNSKTRSSNAEKSDGGDKKTAITPSASVIQKKLPFIGRMPLFKNRKLSEDPQQPQQSMKGKMALAAAAAAAADSLTAASAAADSDYEMPRQSRFQPGNLARAFIPQPDVVHYPKLTTVPPVLPEPPRISVPQPPPPPKIQAAQQAVEDTYDDVVQYHHQQEQVYEYTEAEFAAVDDHDQLPPLPPMPPPAPRLHFSTLQDSHDDDDLAMLGISSDDMAAQVF